MRIKEGYVLRRIGKIGIIVGGNEEEHIVTLNQTGITLWKMLGEETDLEQLVQKMMEKYDASESVLEKDIKIFLKKMKRVGLLEE